MTEPCQTIAVFELLLGAALLIWAVVLVAADLRALGTALFYLTIPVIAFSELKRLQRAWHREVEPLLSKAWRWYWRY